MAKIYNESALNTTNFTRSLVLLFLFASQIPAPNNVIEKSVRLVDLMVAPGDRVKAEALIGKTEVMKTYSELRAENDGVVRRIFIDENKWKFRVELDTSSPEATQRGYVPRLDYIGDFGISCLKAISREVPHLWERYSRGEIILSINGVEQVFPSGPTPGSAQLPKLQNDTAHSELLILSSRAQSVVVPKRARVSGYKRQFCHAFGSDMYNMAGFVIYTFDVELVDKTIRTKKVKEEMDQVVEDTVVETQKFESDNGQWYTDKLVHTPALDLRPVTVPVPRLFPIW